MSRDKKEHGGGQHGKDRDSSRDHDDDSDSDDKNGPGGRSRDRSKVMSNNGKGDDRDDEDKDGPPRFKFPPPRPGPPAAPFKSPPSFPPSFSPPGAGRFGSGSDPPKATSRPINAEFSPDSDDSSPGESRSGLLPSSAVAHSGPGSVHSDDSADKDSDNSGFGPFSKNTKPSSGNDTSMQKEIGGGSSGPGASLPPSGGAIPSWPNSTAPDPPVISSTRHMSPGIAVGISVLVILAALAAALAAYIVLMQRRMRKSQERTEHGPRQSIQWDFNSTPPPPVAMRQVRDLEQGPMSGRFGGFTESVNLTNPFASIQDADSDVTDPFASEEDGDRSTTVL